MIYLHFYSRRRRFGKVFCIKKL